MEAAVRSPHQQLVTQAQALRALSVTVRAHSHLVRQRSWAIYAGLQVHPAAQRAGVQAAFRRCQEAFQTEYARRAGIEGPISRETRSLRLRRTRDSGLRRVHLGHILAAGGLNVLRLGEWLLEIARAKTRMTPFARLMADAAATA